MMKVRKPTNEEIEMTRTWAVWSKEPSIFPWFYDDKETCYILEGNAIVTGENGHSVSFGPGDWVEFEQGLQCTWKIENMIRKHYNFG